MAFIKNYQTEKSIKKNKANKKNLKLIIEGSEY